MSTLSNSTHRALARTVSALAVLGLVATYRWSTRLSTAVTYLLTMAIGRLAFREPVGTWQIAGCLLIVAGVALIARGPG